MSWSLHRFLLLSLDPLYVGTGGYRLARVELSIAREPGTNVPKVPGTSLSGATRSYAAYRYGKPDCAGKGGVAGERHCGESTCPICYTFGYAKGAAGSYQGTVSIFDAGLLLFPVYSTAGPVWVSTPARLREAGFQVNDAQPTDETAVVTLTNWTKPINLGWLMVDTQAGIGITHTETNILETKEWKAIKDRLVLVKDKLFSVVANSNLEVRTSVSIDPDTGAAESGALFTYEAMPRTSWLVMDVVQDEYRKENTRPWSTNTPVTRKAKRTEEGRWQDNAGDPLYPDPKNPDTPQSGKGWSSPMDVLRSGLEWAEFLGIGGMGTRGFGRVKIVYHWEV